MNLYKTALYVLIAVAIGTYINRKFNHRTAIGDKLEFTHCQVMSDLDGGVTSETIQVHVGEHALKFIEAETRQGAVYGLGFVHGVDRLWQIEFWRRMAQGRLSEIFGAETLQIDKYVRTIGIPRMTDDFMTKISNEDLLLLKNYAAGVNKLVEQLHVYPLEFYLFWTGFEEFTPRDSVAINYLMMNFISTDWFFEMTRTRMLEVYSRSFIDKVLPFDSKYFWPFRENMEMISDQQLASIGLLDLDANLYEVPDDLLFNPSEGKKKKFMHEGGGIGHSSSKYGSALNGQGSNCFAIHGNLTKSRQPLLACDPHLTKLMHSTWYMSSLSWKASESQNASMLVAAVVGTITFSHCRSKLTAFGVTAINPDIMDLFAETLDGDKYLIENDQWAQLQASNEIIKVRFGYDQPLNLRFTRNGVLFPDDLIDGQAHDLMPWVSSHQMRSEYVDGVTKAYALANVYDPIIANQHKFAQIDFNFSLLFKLANDNENITATEFALEMREQYLAPLNIVFVIAKTGEIGYVTGGKFPIRKYNVAQGAYTKKGHLSDNLWQGFVPPQDKAYTVNPSKGFFVSANNYITSKNSKYGYSHAFAFTHRAMRITELIEEQIQLGTLFTAETMKVIQVDHLDIQARASLHDMLKCAVSGNKGRDIGKAVQLLQTWDFRFELNSSAATLFQAWEDTMAEYLHEMTIDSPEIRKSLQNHPAYLSSFYLQVKEWAQVSETREPQCYLKDVINTQPANLPKNTCQEFMAHTLMVAWKYLAAKYGDVGNWELGKVQKCLYTHSPLSEIPILNRIFDHVSPYPGNERTVNPSISFHNVPESKRHVVMGGSVFRMVSDFSTASTELIMDIGSELTNPFTSEHRTAVNQIFNEGGFMTVPREFKSKQPITLSP